MALVLHYMSYGFSFTFSSTCSRKVVILCENRKGVHLGVLWYDNRHPLNDFYSLDRRLPRDLAEEKRFSVGQSALINKAYRTLSKPLSRGLYLLELKGHPVEETNMYISKPEFLMQIMEMNDVLSEAESTDDIEAVTLENSAQLRECLLLLSDAFQEDDIDFAKEILIKLTYYTNVDDKIKEMHRKEMDN